MTAPTEVTWLAASLDHVPMDDGWVDDGMATRLAGLAYQKRYSEVRLARWTAKQAIALTLQHPTDSLRSVEVRNAPDGAPEAFVDGEQVPAVIAMTDRADWAVCMVARGHARIGCDLELVEPRSRAFVGDYLTGTEQQTVSQAADPELAANLIWSAKESALKVLRTGLRRDTRTVEVTLLPSASGDWSGLEVKDQTGQILPGWWNRYGNFVLTWCGEAPMPAPVSLVEPTPLSTAQPSHRWMEQPMRHPLPFLRTSVPKTGGRNPQEQ